MVISVGGFSEPAEYKNGSHEKSFPWGTDYAGSHCHAKAAVYEQIPEGES